VSRFLLSAGAACLVAWICAPVAFSAQGAGARADSPASQRPPQTAVPQSYAPEQIAAGRTVFAAQCGFCHGRDAMGGETGPDLTRSALVAEDVHGDRIAPVVRGGRLEKKMPAFNLGDADLAAVVAFVHDAKTRADSAEGGRRAVDVSDLQTGDAAAGRRYFDGAGGCAACHSATGDLNGIARRLSGLALMEELLYPTGRGGGRGAAPPAASVTVTLPSGQTITGRLAYRDEFVIALTDPSGAYRSWPLDAVKAVVNDKLDAHFLQLARYTKDDLHNVFAYLQTLK
jgi:cytochrome c oxidase cbb3-type subunit 3